MGPLSHVAVRVTLAVALAVSLFWNGLLVLIVYDPAPRWLEYASDFGGACVPVLLIMAAFMDLACHFGKAPKQERESRPCDTP